MISYLLINHTEIRAIITIKITNTKVTTPPATPPPLLAVDAVGEDIVPASVELKLLPTAADHIENFLAVPVWFLLWYNENKVFM